MKKPGCITAFPQSEADRKAGDPLDDSELLQQAVQFLVLISSAMLCYLPMHRQLRFSPRKTTLLAAGTLLVYIPAAAWCTAALGLDCNIILLPYQLLFCVGYRLTLKTDWSRCICTFLFSCAVSAFVSNFSYAYDAWGSMIAVSAAFLLLNLAIIPGTMPPCTWADASLYILRCGAAVSDCDVRFFLPYGNGDLKHSAIQERIQFFEMAENQYRMRRKYIENTAKERHDFKQSVFTLKQLAAAGNLTALQQYLTKYVSTLPETEIRQFCKSHAVNALLNYYAQLAASNGIQLD